MSREDHARKHSALSALRPRSSSAVVLALVAVLMTGKGDAPPLPPTPVAGWLVALVLVALLTIPVFSNSALAGAVCGFIFLALTALYTWALFHCNDDWLCKAKYLLLSLPVATNIGRSRTSDLTLGRALRAHQLVYCDSSLGLTVPSGTTTTGRARFSRRRVRQSMTGGP